MTTQNEDHPPLPHILYTQYGNDVSYQQNLTNEFATLARGQRLALIPMGQVAYHSLLEFFEADDNAFCRERFLKSPYEQVQNAGRQLLNTPQEDRGRQHYLYVPYADAQSGVFTICIQEKETQKIVGALFYWQDHNKQHRLSYFILPSERNKGYASESYQLGLDFLKANGADIKYAQVKKDNVPSLRLLQHHGFSQSGLVGPDDPDNENRGDNHLRMTREI